MDLAKVLRTIRPGAEWTLNGDNYDGLTWIGPGEPPTKAECEAAWPAIADQLAVNEIRNARQKAFVLEADPLYFGWQRGEATENDWLTKCAEIRARYPYA